MEEKSKREKLLKITITVPESTVKLIDFGANENKISRSRWFLQAAAIKISYDAENKIDKIVRG